MPKPFDSATKRLIDLHPQDWLRLLGFPSADFVEPFDVKFLDTDLSTISASSDRVLKILKPLEMLIHLELETGHHGSEKPNDLLNYSALLTRKYKLPVATSVILLRRDADSPALTGALEYSHTDGTAYLRFAYNVIRLWEIPVAQLLAGGIGTLPLVPLSNVREDELPAIVRELDRRFHSEGGSETPELWTATKILMGLRYPLGLADTLLKGVREMRESVTYQAILEEGEAKGRAEGRNEGRVEGRVEGERRLLLNLGARRFGPVPTEIAAIIDEIDSPEQLTELGYRLLAVESWDELIRD